MKIKYLAGVVLGATIGALIAYSVVMPDENAGGISDVSPSSPDRRPVNESVSVTSDPMAVSEYRETIEAFASRGASEPTIALAEALVLEGGTRRAVVREIAAVWARQEPVAALDYTRMLPPDLQMVFRDSIAREWASRDAATFLDFADNAADIDMLSAGLELLVPVQPERVFEISQRLSPLTTPFFTTVGAKALRHMVEVNRSAALAYLESLPASARREQFMMEGSAALAFEDPDAAFAWAAESGSAMALMGAMTSVSARDFELALALAAEYSDPRAPNRLDGMLVAGTLNDTRNMPGIMSGLYEKGDARSLQLLSALSNAWMRKDTRAALAWLTDSDREIGSATISSAAAALARADTEAAFRYLDDLPTEWRDEWIGQIAIPYGATDPEGAVSLIDELRRPGNAAYDAAYAGIIASAAQDDPITAARIFDNASEQVQSATVGNLALNWAAQDPRAAGNWASSLRDADNARSAVWLVSSQWLASDPEGAGNWALGLRRGEVRDSALNEVVRSSVSHSLDLTDYLAAFSSEDARRESIGGIIDTLVAANPANAREFVESLPRLPIRAWAEEQLPD